MFDPPGRLNRLLISNQFWLWPVVAWTLIAGVSIFWNARGLNEQAIDLTTERGRFIYKFVQASRLWNARHGGVYVPITENTQPNPYLVTPRRDIQATDGQRLTLINPAFMTRQIAEVIRESGGAEIRLTSLKPLRPENAADPWEAESLRAFEQGVNERTEIFHQPDGALFRFMAPLVTQSACLSCHAHQGYQVGDIRGGLSITFPADAILEGVRIQQQNVILVHLGMWALLTGVSLWLMARIRNDLLILQKIRKRHAASAIPAQTLEAPAAEERFSMAVVDAIDAGVIVINEHGQIILWSRGAERLFRLDEGSMVGAPLEGLIPDWLWPAHRKQFRERLEKCDESWPGRTLETIALRGDGVEFPVEISLSAWTREGSPTFCAVVRDISSRKEAQRQELERHMAHRRFLEVMKDEIRTPLNALGGVVDLLVDTELTPQQRELVEGMEQSAVGVGAIFDDVLALVQPEIEPGPEERSPVNLTALIDEVFSGQAAQARQKGVALRRGVAADIPETIQADIQRLRIVLTKLVSNAVRFTQRGFVRVEAGLLEGDGKAQTLMITVQDTGIGLDKKARQALLTPKALGEGENRGMGLRICQQFIESWGGRFDFHGESGRGTTFRFSLPLRKSHNEEVPELPEATSDTELAAGGQTPPPRLLLVEDDPVNRRVLVGMLRGLGLTPEEAENGQQALDILGHATFDLVLMDCQMPVMDGFTACRTLRRREKGRRTPVAAVTAFALSGDEQRCHDAGMDDYLAKPVRKKDLQALLDRWLKPGPHELEPSSPPTAVESGPAIDNPEAIGPAIETRPFRLLLQELGQEAVDEVISLFLETLPARLEAVHQAVASGEAERIHLATHPLKSPSHQIGARRFSRLATEMDTQARQGIMDGVEALAALLEEEAQRVRGALNERRAG